jgi:hypothetical protein
MAYRIIYPEGLARLMYNIDAYSFGGLLITNDLIRECGKWGALWAALCQRFKDEVFPHA